MNSLDLPNQEALGQYFTPSWAAEAILENYFPDLGIWDRGLEPSCGPGAFLSAIPDYVQALGVEIDPALAKRARENTGREIIVGDFNQVELPFSPTFIVGNPPFKQTVVQSFFDRAWDILPDGGRCGFILPCYAFASASVVDRLAQRWHIKHDLLPKALFPRIAQPICFALLTKGKRGLCGFSLFHEAKAISQLQKRYRKLLAAGEGSAWTAVTRAAMEMRGGTCTLTELYSEIEGARPTTNTHWKEKVRQTVQRIAVRVGPGTWQLPVAMAEAA